MHYRGLTAFLSLSGFILMVVTGVILYIEPEGRIAYWVHWDLFGLEKTQWGNIHVVASFLWVAAGAFHLYFNWNVLTAYIYSRARGGWRLKKELVLALAVSVVVVWGSIAPFPPFSQFLDLGSYLKESWVTKPEYEPPFGHAEMLSFKTLARKTNIPLDAALVELKKKGVEVPDPEQALETIARANRTTPMDLFIMIRHLEVKAEAPKAKAFTTEMVEEAFEGKGAGKKTLAQAAAEFGLDLADIQARMARKNITIADAETLHDASGRYGVNALDLLKALLVDDYRLAGK